MRILIVENNASYLNSMRSSLEEHGHDITEATDLGEASERLTNQRYDVILLDLTLPDSYGVETFSRVRSLNPDVPIVVFTELDEEDLALEAVERGAHGHVIKGLASNDAIYRRLEYAIEKNKVEIQLRRSEKRLRIILENSYDAFISTDSKWRITDWNSQAVRTFGWTKTEALGRPLSSIVPRHMRKQYANQVEKHFSKEEWKVLRATYEFLAIDRHGHEFPVEFVIFKIREDVDYMFCAFIRDISETKKLNEELHRLVDERTEQLTKSIEELKQFAKIASHDLQEPLRTVQGFANLLVESTRGKLDQDSSEFVEYIVDATKRMQTLIQAVLTHSNITSEDSANHATNCQSVVDDVLVDLGSKIRETEAFFEIGELPEVAVERSHLSQLFLNLISNALKYRSDDPPEIHITADRSGDKWLFSVRDNGIGIDPRYSDKIFDMFARLHGKTQYSGTGMGLAICKRIVTSHGGTISVESEPGQGSIFLFTLPAVSKIKERIDERED